MLPNLAIIDLNECVLSEDRVYSAGGFAGLKYFHVQNLRHLRRWRIELEHCPNWPIYSLHFRIRCWCCQMD